MGMTTPAFDKAAEISRNDKSGKIGTAGKLRGYGLYKVATTGTAPEAADCPSVLNVLQAEKRQKWLAHEAAWKETNGDAALAQLTYVRYTEECQGMAPGSIEANL